MTSTLVWADGGDANVSSNSPTALAARHHLIDELREPLDAIDAITSALVAPEI